MKAITDNLLEKLAGPGAFKRGKAYYEQGHVAEFKRRGRTITALVEGTETWRVTLRHTAAVFEGSCDCPASENFDFCKHCVATAMAYRDELEQQDQLKKSSGKDRLPAYLLTWEKQALVDLTLELLACDRPRLNALRVQADIAAGSFDDKAIKKQITAAIPYNRHLFRYAQVRNYFQSVESVLETLAPQLKTLSPDKALQLIDYAMARIERALETIDDSGGFRFPAVALLTSLHLETLQRSDMSPERLAGYLYGLYTEPVIDLYPAIPDDYAEVLGTEGRKQFIAIIRREWDKLPPLASDDWDQKFAYWRLQQPLLKEAELTDDIEARIALKIKTATGFRDYLELSALCLENDQADKALYWRRKAEKDSNKPYHSQAALEENQIAIWSHGGDYDAVLKTRWRQFLEDPSLQRYQAIVSVPGAGRENAIRKSALTKLRDIQSQAADRPAKKQAALNTAAEIHLFSDQAEEALALAESEALHPDLLLHIAQANDKFPDRTLPLYFRVAAFHVRQGNNQSYKTAIDILKSCRQHLPKKLYGAFVVLAAEMLEKFKQKRNFAKWLREAFPDIRWPEKK